MNEEEFNMSMRKFLKRVGVTSQQKIEEAVREGLASGRIKSGSIKARMKLTIDGLDFEHTIDGDIAVSGDTGAVEG